MWQSITHLEPSKKSVNQLGGKYCKILRRAAWRPDCMSQSERPLLSNVHNQKAYLSGNGVRTSLVAPVLQAFPMQHTYETQEWNPWTWDLLYRRLSVIRDRTDMISSEQRNQS
jgi:hypothetical protein